MSSNKAGWILLLLSFTGVFLEQWQLQFPRFIEIHHSFGWLQQVTSWKGVATGRFDVHCWTQRRRTNGPPTGMRSYRLRSLRKMG